MKAIGLIRVSTAVQELESQSIKVKEAILRDGYDESDVILIEDKESGSKLSEEERSGLNKLKQVIETEQISSVYCYELSRISRRASVVYSIRDYLISRKINLICLNPFFRMLREDGSFDENSNLAFGIFSTMAENENSLRKARIMRGKEKKKNEGKLSVGKPFFGYTLDSNHRPIPHPIESPIVQEIFERYVNKRESSGSIAKDLYLRKAFRDDSNKLLTIQNYICVVLREKRYANLVESIYPPIISKELFKQAEEIRTKSGCKFTRKSRTKSVYPLQGYLFTTDGYRLTIGVTNNRYLKMNDATVQRISLRMDAADNLTRIVLQDYFDKGVIEEDKEKTRLVLNEQLSINRIKIGSIKSKIENLRKENDFINTRIIKGRLSESKGDAMIDENYKQMEQLEDTMQDLYYRISQDNAKLTLLANPIFNDYSKDVDLSSNENLRAVVEKYIKQIIVRRIKFSTYSLEYHFLDGCITTYSFYSINRGVKYFDASMNEVQLSR